MIWILKSLSINFQSVLTSNHGKLELIASYRLIPKVKMLEILIISYITLELNFCTFN